MNWIRPVVAASLLAKGEAEVQLLAQLKTKIADGRLLTLIESFLTAGILDGVDEWTPASGAPQGAVIAPPTILLTTAACWIE